LGRIKEVRAFDWFEVELKTWPAGSFTYLLRAPDEEDAKRQGQVFLLSRRWKGQVGKVVNLGGGT